MVSFQADEFTDRLQDVLGNRIRRGMNRRPIGSSHLNRLIGLILSASKNREEALSVAESMPALSYGKFRLDCKTMEWIVLE